LTFKSATPGTVFVATVTATVVTPPSLVVSPSTSASGELLASVKVTGTAASAASGG
jgi:hypothetical protein